MLRGTWTCARLSLQEALRARLLWMLALYAGALLLAVPATAGVAPAGRPAAVATALHAVTAFLGSFLVLAHSARGIPSDLRQRLLATVLTKPVSPAAYFLGRFLGAACVATLFSAAAALIGGVATLLAGQAWGERQTVQVVSAAPSLSVDGKRLRVAWPVETIPSGLAARIRLVNNPYDEPRLALAWRRGESPSVPAEPVRLMAGKRTVDIPVPEGLAGPGPLELAIGFPDGGASNPVAWAAPPELIAAGRDELRLWTGHVAILWGALLFAAGVTTFLSVFCAWSLAFAAGAVFLLAGYSHDFLGLLPQTLEPQKLSSLFSPTIYRYRHAPSHEHAGHDRSPPIEDLIGALRRFASRAMPCLLAALPDLDALEPARRLADGVVTPQREILRHTTGILARVLPLVLAGAFLMTRKEAT